MMKDRTRGALSSLLDIRAYTQAVKRWHVTLERSEFFWFDLVVDPPPSADTRGYIRKYLDSVRAQVEAAAEHRFIYFYLARKRVRFDARRQPRRSRFGFGKELIVNLVIGRDDKRSVKVGPQRAWVNGNLVELEVEVDERFIYLTGPDFAQALSVHDFLKLNGVALGISSEVAYVGLTSDPSERPINRKHRGYADAIHFFPSSDFDIFLSVNVFKPVSDGILGNSGMRVVIANSLTDEILVGEEGEVIEAALIHYFDAKANEDDTGSWGKFRRLLGEVLAKKNIRSVSIHLEQRSPSEYDLLGSRKIAPAISHSLCWTIKDGQPALHTFSSEEDLATFSESFPAHTS